MAGVVTNHDQVSFSIAPSRMFHALFVDGHNLMPKILPQAIKSVELISGDGSSGSILKVNFPEGGPFTYVKERLDLLDKDNFICKYTMIEGDVLGDKISSISYEITFEPVADGCVCKITSHHHTKEGAEISQEELMGSKEQIKGMYKVVENYLAENPSVYA